MRECKHACCPEVCRKKKEPKRRVPIKKKSKKRAKMERLYSKKAKEFKEKNEVCQAQIAIDCGYFATDVHHPGGRENDLLNEDKLFMGVCRNCHDWIHRNPGKARELGLIVTVSKFKRA